MQKYDSVKTLTYENFVKVIDKLPKEIRITFSGFTEPFLNKRTSDMILYAHSKGHRISVFTTGVGLTIEDIKKIKHIDGPKRICPLCLAVCPMGCWIWVIFGVPVQ